MAGPRAVGGILARALAVIAAFAPSLAAADAAQDRAAIIARLHGWAAAFNARDAEGACALFAPDLLSTAPGAVDSGKDAVCNRLRQVLARPGLRLHYTPDIQEVIVAGDVAIVRLLWTLTAEREGQPPESSLEAGLDIFARQPDGSWAIRRFMAFTIAPPSPR